MSRHFNAPPFHPRTLYQAPSGRLCLFTPGGKGNEVADFTYVRLEHELTRMTDGFSLTRANWYILKPVMAPGAGT